MKKIIPFLFILILSVSAKAQVLYPYSFSSSTLSYQDLVGGTNVFPNIRWDDSVVKIPIGFNFTWAYNNYSIDSILLDTYGILHAKVPDTMMTFYPNSGMSGYWGDLCDLAYNDTSISAPAKSKISYLTTGAVGSRIFKVEFNNAGFYNDTLMEDSVNFQIWLYEGSNAIEYHYGAQSVQDPDNSFDATGPHIGLEYKTTFSFTNQIYTLDSISYVTGTNTAFSNVYSTTTIDPFSAQGFPNAYFMTGLPDSGQVFRYTPMFETGVYQTSLFKNTIVYPSLFTNELHIKTDLKDYTITLYNTQGQVALSTQGEGSVFSLDTHHLSPGLYQMRLSNGPSFEVYALIKE